MRGFDLFYNGLDQNPPANSPVDEAASKKESEDLCTCTRRISTEETELLELR